MVDFWDFFSTGLEGAVGLSFLLVLPQSMLIPWNDRYSAVQYGRKLNELHLSLLALSTFVYSEMIEGIGLIFRLNSEVVAFCFWDPVNLFPFFVCWVF